MLPFSPQNVAPGTPRGKQNAAASHVHYTRYSVKLRKKALARLSTGLPRLPVDDTDSIASPDFHEPESDMESAPPMEFIPEPTPPPPPSNQRGRRKSVMPPEEPSRRSERLRRSSMLEHSQASSSAHESASVQLDAQPHMPDLHLLDNSGSDYLSLISSDHVGGPANQESSFWNTADVSTFQKVDEYANPDETPRYMTRLRSRRSLSSSHVSSKEPSVAPPVIEYEEPEVSPEPIELPEPTFTQPEVEQVEEPRGPNFVTRVKCALSTRALSVYAGLLWLIATVVLGVKVTATSIASGAGAAGRSVGHALAVSASCTKTAASSSVSVVSTLLCSLHQLILTGIKYALYGLSLPFVGVYKSIQFIGLGLRKTVQVVAQGVRATTEYLGYLLGEAGAGLSAGFNAALSACLRNMCAIGLGCWGGLVAVGGLLLSLGLVVKRVPVTIGNAILSALKSVGHFIFRVFVWIGRGSVVGSLQLYSCLVYLKNSTVFGLSSVGNGVARGTVVAVHASMQPFIWAGVFTCSCCTTAARSVGHGALVTVSAVTGWGSAVRVASHSGLVHMTRVATGAFVACVYGVCAGVAAMFRGVKCAASSTGNLFAQSILLVALSTVLALVKIGECVSGGIRSIARAISHCVTSVSQAVAAGVLCVGRWLMTAGRYVAVVPIVVYRGLRSACISVFVSSPRAVVNAVMQVLYLALVGIKYVCALAADGAMVVSQGLMSVGDKAVLKPARYVCSLTKTAFVEMPVSLYTKMVVGVARMFKAKEEDKSAQEEPAVEPTPPVAPVVISSRLRRRSVAPDAVVSQGTLQRIRSHVTENVDEVSSSSSESLAPAYSEPTKWTWPQVIGSAVACLLLITLASFLFMHTIKIKVPSLPVWSPSGTQAPVVDKLYDKQEMKELKDMVVGLEADILALRQQLRTLGDVSEDRVKSLLQDYLKRSELPDTTVIRSLLQQDERLSGLLTQVDGKYAQLPEEVQGLISEVKKLTHDEHELSEALNKLSSTAVTKAELQQLKVALEEVVKKATSEEMKQRREDLNSLLELVNTKLSQADVQVLIDTIISDGLSAQGKISQAIRDAIDAIPKTPLPPTTDLSSIKQEILSALRTEAQLSASKAELQKVKDDITALQTKRDLSDDVSSLAAALDSLKLDLTQLEAQGLEKGDIMRMVYAEIEKILEQGGQVDQMIQSHETQALLKTQAELSTIVQQAVQAAVDRMPKSGDDKMVDVYKVVSQAIDAYDADQVKMIDWALFTLGATVDREHTSQSYMAKTNFVASLFYDRNPPETALKQGHMPGQCWAFAGDSGVLSVKLREPILVRNITLEHSPLEINPVIDSAPRDFALFGIIDGDFTNRVPLGVFTYKITDRPVQTWPTLDAHAAVSHVMFNFTSNYGNTEFTCIYRIRVHGARA